MAMEDILKALVDSRQQGGASQQGSDPMANLIGSLLGGTPSQSQAPVNPNAGGTDLSGMMGLLETFMGGQNNASAGGAANDPVMMLISPFVPSLAKKANVSPEIAMIVISFVVHKLLAHHPSSGRDSNSFNLDEMLGQMSSGKVDTTLLHQSGMVNELSKKTGLDEAATEQVLQLAFAAVGKTVGGMVAKGGAAKPSSAGSTAKSAAGVGSLGNSGAKRGGNKIER
jgi:hypothetical protein